MLALDATIMMIGALVIVYSSVAIGPWLIDKLVSFDRPFLKMALMIAYLVLLANGYIWAMENAG